MRCFEVLAVNSLVLLSACGYATDDLPTISDDWIITLESASRVGEAEFPLSVEVTFGVEGLGPTNSGPPPDATNLSLTTVFSETEVEQTVQTPIYDGVAQVTVVLKSQAAPIARPGSEIRTWCSGSKLQRQARCKYPAEMVHQKRNPF